MTPSMQNASYWVGGDVPWISSGDVKVAHLTATSYSVTTEAVTQGKTPLMPAGSIVLVVRSGILRKFLPVAMTMVPMAINQDIKALAPFPGYDADFLLHALIGAGPKILGSCLKSGTTVESIELSWLKAFALPLPPTEAEQRAIAAALSDVDALLDGLDRLIAKKRDLKQAAMQQLLSGETRIPGFEGPWVVERLGSIAEIVMGQSPASANYNTKGNGLPLVQGNADVENRRTIRRIFTTQVTKRGNAGDIVMTVRAPVGEVSRAEFDLCLGRGVCAIRFPNDFLYHYLIYIEPRWVKHSKGSTFDSVTGADVKAVEIRLPVDSAEQSEIASVLNDMDAELLSLEARREKTRALKQAMLQDLLTGKVRLRDLRKEGEK